VTTDKGRLGVLRDMAEAVHKTGNGVLIDKYAQKTALRLGVTPDAVRTEFKKARKFKSAPQEAEEQPADQTSSAPAPSAHEAWLLRLLLVNEELVPSAAEHLDLDWLQHEGVRQVVTERIAAFRNQTWTNLAAFLGVFESPEAQGLITEATMQERPLPHPAQQLQDVLIWLRNQSLDKRLAMLFQKSSQPATSEEERIQILREQSELRLMKRQPLQVRAEATGR